jgi:predicted TIM-barrel fold metal-dependent hydrolase
VFTGALDLDSHEMMPTHMYPAVFGAIGAKVEAIYNCRRAVESEPSRNDLTRPDITGDVAPIDPATIWAAKGPDSPGAIDMNRRVEVLDAMGIERQLVFPSFGFIGLLLASLSDAEYAEFFDGESCGHRQVGLDAIRAHNDWAHTLSSLSGRQRHVAVLPTFDYDEMMAEGERLAALQPGAIWIPANVPPGGTSPANVKLDEFWSIFERHDVPVVLHVNTDRFSAREWWDTPLFQRQKNTELLQSAFFMATSNFVVENYLASLVIGGVLDRHPGLRVGIIECGAQWLGPLVERMELFWDYFPLSKASIPMRPTEYVARQVRVTPMFVEPVDLYLDRYPQLADVYCYSSDYPHIEGGIASMATFAAKLERFGDDIMAKFFRTNAELLMPLRG